MLPKILTTFLLLFAVSIYSQEARILLSEKKTGKRIVLIAENTTKDTLHVFLIVNSEGYRKSAARPVLKKVPPFGKTPMITLIEIQNIPSTYTYELIVSEKENSLNLDMDTKAKDIEKIISGKLVLFTTAYCEKCELLGASLKSKNVQHRSFNIAQDPVLYRQFIAFISDELKGETKIKFPVIWNKDHTIFGYKNLEEVLKKLVSSE